MKNEVGVIGFFISLIIMIMMFLYALVTDNRIVGFIIFVVMLIVCIVLIKTYKPLGYR